MKLKNRTNLKLFSSLSIVALGLFLFFAKNQNEVFGILIVYIATLINLYMLLYSVAVLMLNPEAIRKGEFEKGRVLLFFAGKMFVLFLGISLGVHFMGNRIILAILNYVVQIFILGVSLKRN